MILIQCFIGSVFLNLHVLDLNYNSTFTEIIKAYCSMARRFHPDNNYGYHTTEMMKMTNTAKDGLQYRLRDQGTE